MKLCTHNTMSYQSPKKWWMKLIAFTGKCQRVNYVGQYMLGARGFDLRLFWDEKGELEFRHGILSYNADEIYNVLDFAQDNGVIVRVLLELREFTKGNEQRNNDLKNKFKEFCTELEKKYPSIRFYGGRSTGSWEILYEFKGGADLENEISMYSSTTSLFGGKDSIWFKKLWLRMLDDWCPWLYAKLRNKKNIKEYSDMDDNCYLVVDFIDIQ